VFTIYEHFENYKGIDPSHVHLFLVSTPKYTPDLMNYKETDVIGNIII